MSVTLFGLAHNKINKSDYVGTIYLDKGPEIKMVSELGVVKGQPSLAFAKIDSDETGKDYFYFQVKDLIGFIVDGDVGEVSHEDEKDED